MAPGKTKAASAAPSKAVKTASKPTVKAVPATLPVPGLGNLLREAREARGLSVETVAEELMIRRYYLDALEDGQYRLLPERVYAVGFVSNYAQLLGLDADALTEQFKREAYGGRGAASSRMELTMPTPVSQSLLPNRSAILIVAVLLIGLVIAGLAWNARQPNAAAARITPPPANQADLSINSVANPPAGSPAAPVPDKTAIVSSRGTTMSSNMAAAPELGAPEPGAPELGAPDFAAPETSVPAQAAPTAPVQASAAAPLTAPPITAPQGTRIMIEAIQPSWVEIADADGNILFTNILRLGQALPIPNKGGITLTTGNAAGVQIVLDGKKLGPLGRTGEVKRAIPLDAAKLSTSR